MSWAHALGLDEGSFGPQLIIPLVKNIHGISLGQIWRMLAMGVEKFGLALEGKVCYPNIFVIYVLRNFTYLCTLAFEILPHVNKICLIIWIYFLIFELVMNL